MAGICYIGVHKKQLALPFILLDTARTEGHKDAAWPKYAAHVWPGLPYQQLLSNRGELTNGCALTTFRATWVKVLPTG